MLVPTLEALTQIAEAPRPHQVLEQSTPAGTHPFRFCKSTGLMQRLLCVEGETRMGQEVERTQQVTPQLNISGNEEKENTASKVLYFCPPRGSREPSSPRKS